MNAEWPDHRRLEQLIGGGGHARSSVDIRSLPGVTLQVVDPGTGSATTSVAGQAR